MAGAAVAGRAIVIAVVVVLVAERGAGTVALKGRLGGAGAVVVQGLRVASSGGLLDGGGLARHVGARELRAGQRDRDQREEHKLQHSRCKEVLPNVKMKNEPRLARSLLPCALALVLLHVRAVSGLN